MNKHALRYQTYKALLEADLTSKERQTLIEAGFMDKLIGVLGGAKDTITTDMVKLYKDNKFGRRTLSAQKNIEKELDELKSIAKDSGKDENVVYDILYNILKKKNITPGEVASPPERSGSEGEGETKNVPPGRPVDASNASGKSASSTPAGALAVDMLANLSGVDKAKAMAQAKEKDVTFEEAKKKLSLQVAEETEDKVDTVRKVIDWLFDNKKIIPKEKVTYVYGESIGKKSNNLIFERWERLAGLIKEDSSQEKLDEEILDASGRPVKKTDAQASGDKDAPASGDKKDEPKSDGNKESKPSGVNSKLASLVARETDISPKVVAPILDVLVQKCGVKFAN